VFLSARSGEGLALLRSALSDIVKAALPAAPSSEPDPRELYRDYPGDPP
jgi:GTP-binding protein HflX